MNTLSLLTKAGLLKEEDVSVINAEAKGSAASVEAVLEKRGITIEQILKVRSEHYDLPNRMLTQQAIPKEVLEFIPEESAKHYGFVPLAIADAAALFVALPNVGCDPHYQSGSVTLPRTENAHHDARSDTHLA